MINNTIARPVPASSGTEFDKKLLSQRFYLGARSLTKIGRHWDMGRYPFSQVKAFEYYTDPDIAISVGFGKETSYGAFDIDRGSPYHPANDGGAGLGVLLEALELVGIVRPVIVRSSESGGLHVYIITEKVGTWKLACLLETLVKAAGLDIAPGTLELFPNKKAWNSDYKHLRAPLQAGSYLLDIDLNIIPISQERFLTEYWDSVAAGQDMETFQRYLEGKKVRGISKLVGTQSNIAPEQTTSDQPYSEYYKKRYQSLAASLEAAGLGELIDPGSMHEWVTQALTLERLFAASPSNNRQYYRQKGLTRKYAGGWTGPGQTNEILLLISKDGYLNHGLRGDEHARFIVETARSLPGYLQYCDHQSNIEQRAGELAKAALTNAKLNAAIGEEVGPNKNVVRAQEAVQRIVDGMAALESQGILPAGIEERRKALIAHGASSKSLYKHKPLWHPRHYHPAQSPQHNTKTPTPITQNSLPSAQGVEEPITTGVSAIPVSNISTNGDANPFTDPVANLLADPVVPEQTNRSNKLSSPPSSQGGEEPITTGITAISESNNKDKEQIPSLEEVEEKYGFFSEEYRLALFSRPLSKW